MTYVTGGRRLARARNITITSAQAVTYAADNGDNIGGVFEAADASTLRLTYTVSGFAGSGKLGIIIDTGPDPDYDSSTLWATVEAPTASLAEPAANGTYTFVIGGLNRYFALRWDIASGVSGTVTITGELV